MNTIISSSIYSVHVNFTNRDDIVGRKRKLKTERKPYRCFRIKLFCSHTEQNIDVDRKVQNTEQIISHGLILKHQQKIA